MDERTSYGYDPANRGEPDGTIRTVAHDRREAAYEAVYEVLDDQPSSVQENARVWRGVHAALDAAGVPHG